MYLGPVTAESVQNPPLKASAVLKLSGIKTPNGLLGRGKTNEACTNPPLQHNFLSQTLVCGKHSLIYLQAFSSGGVESREGGGQKRGANE